MSDDDIVRYHRSSGAFRTSDAERARLEAMTDQEIEAAAKSDPDARPLTDEQLARMKRVTIARSARWRSGLTQEAFAAAFGFTVGRLRDLEQGRTQPDGATEAYLRLIRADPDGVREKLKNAA